MASGEVIVVVRVRQPKLRPSGGDVLDKGGVGDVLKCQEIVPEVDELCSNEACRWNRRVPGNTAHGDIVLFAALSDCRHEGLPRHDLCRPSERDAVEADVVVQNPVCGM